jgi:NADH-quinone oxidoreductase subunit A
MASLNVWALSVYTAAVLVIVGVMLLLSHLLGQRHHDRATDDPYESGIVSTGSAEIRFSARFYLVAMLFVIFDLEAALLFAWAVGVRETGWSAFIAVSVFIGILLVALFYEWRQGALDLGPKPRARRRTPEAEAAGLSARAAVTKKEGERALVAH